MDGEAKPYTLEERQAIVAEMRAGSRWAAFDPLRVEATIEEARREGADRALAEVQHRIGHDRVRYERR